MWAESCPPLNPSSPIRTVSLPALGSSALPSICNHACVRDVSCERSLTCNCVKGAASSILNAGAPPARTTPLSMFNALLLRSLISHSPPPPVKADCHFGIDPPLAANEKELCLLGLGAAVFIYLFFWTFHFAESCLAFQHLAWIPISVNRFAVYTHRACAWFG